jgi:hypothetical protein
MSFKFFKTNLNVLQPSWTMFHSGPSST